MADFPELTPQSRTYTPGSYAVLRTSTLSGDDVAVRRTNSASNYRLRLVFVSGSTQDQNKVFTHYALHHRFASFDLPSSVLSGADITFPSGYKWIYAVPPEVEFQASTVTVSVDLQLVAPYELL